MVFSSPVFVFIFLPAVLGVGLLAPRRFRNLLLVIASLVFYAWGAGDFVLLMLLTTAVDFGLGLGIGRAHDLGRQRLSRLLLIASILQNLVMLGYFKYANFFVAEFDRALAEVGVDSVTWTRVVLPIGISFFTFERISYTADVYTRVTPPCRSPINFLLFTAFFPRSIAGPIVRYREISDQLASRTTSLDNVAAGLMRFALGLAKKVIVADAVAPVANAAFSQPNPTTTTAWVGAIAFTLQIYFDFSGYSDMAIGIARALGFTLPENFNRPYSAVSVTDFWRRWHITLSRWFRDYVYVPLGGSRVTTGLVYRNLVLTFLLTGFWHGASWTFIVWGAYHGTWLLIERALNLRGMEPDLRYVVVRRIVTLLAVIFGWVLFRANSFGEAQAMLGAMIRPTGGGLDDAVSETLTPLVLAVGAAASVVFILPRAFSAQRLITAGTGLASVAMRGALLLVLFPWSLVLVASGTFSPFLYFRF